MSHTTYRNRHDREEHHFGTMEATLVELSSALGVDLPAGTTLEAAIIIVNDRITRQENADVYVRTMKADAIIKASASGSFTADAYTVVEVVDSVLADAIIKASLSGSLTADAWFASGTVTDTFTADAIVKALMSGSFTADAVRLASIGPLTFSANAWLVATTVDSFSADAWIKGIYTITADAVISDGTEAAEEATLGDMTLGDDTLGG